MDTMLDLLTDNMPEWFNRAKLLQRTRAVLSIHGRDLEGFRPGDIPTSHEDDHDALVFDFLGYGEIFEHENREWVQRVIMQRSELLKILSHAHHKLDQRYENARKFVSEHVEFYSGWDGLVHTSEEFQLDQNKPWWRSGDPLLNYSEILTHGKDTKALKSEGYRRIDRGVYIERIRHTMMRHLLADLDQRPVELYWAARLMVLYAMEQRLWKKVGLRTLIKNHTTVLISKCQEALARQHALLPMKPLYSLPREANNISKFFISRASDLVSDEEKSIVRGTLDRAGVKVVTEQGGQRALFFDADLVTKRSGKQDAFISLELEQTPQADILGALMKAIEQFAVEPSVFEHLPRVCAGMFAAAHRDRKLQFNYPGTFWDTESGNRLCRIIGFNADNGRHRKRVQDARLLLQNFLLHREVKGRDEQGRRVELKWSGPIIEARRAKLELKMDQREGMSDHHVFQSFSISKELWEMTLPEDEGGSPSFMLLDERAFALDDRSSLPFNIYWTLVNRAYMGAYTHIEEDRVQADGTFCPRLWTLHDWAGMENTYIKVKRTKQRFTESFELMVEHGLLLSWECEVLDESRQTSLEDLKQARIKVRFSEEQLENFPDSVMQPVVTPASHRVHA